MNPTPPPTSATRTPAETLAPLAAIARVGLDVIGAIGATLRRLARSSR